MRYKKNNRLVVIYLFITISAIILLPVNILAEKTLTPEQLWETSHQIVYEHAGADAGIHLICQGRNIIERYIATILAFKLDTHRYSVSKSSGTEFILPNFENMKSLSPHIYELVTEPDILMLINLTNPNGPHELEICLWNPETDSKVLLSQHRLNLPESLTNLKQQVPERMPRPDEPWLKLLTQLSTDCGPAEKGFKKGLNLVVGSFFHENGYWEKAVSNLQQYEHSTVSSCFIKLITANIWAGDMEKAENAITEMLKLHPDSGPLYASKAWVTLRKGEIEDALMFLEQARLSDVRREGFYTFAKFLTLRDSGRQEDAERPLVTAVETLPDNPLVQMQAARFYWRRAELEKAIDHYKKAIEAGTENKEVFIELGLAFDAVGQTQEAIEAFMDAFEHQRDDISVARHLSTLLQSAGRYEDAIAIFSEYVAANPDNAVAAATLGDLQLHSWKIQESRASYRKALSIDPDFAHAHIKLAVTFLIEKNHDKSLEVLKALLEKQPRNAQTQTMLGKTYAEKGRFDEAIELLQEAAKIPEHEHLARIELANTFLKTGEKDKAIREAQLAVSSEPDAASFATLAKAFLHNERIRDAEHTLDKGLQTNPDSPDLLITTAKVELAKTKNIDEKEEIIRGLKLALEYAEKAIESTPFYVTGYRLAGEVALKMNELEKATAYWEKALELDKWDAELAWDLAELLNVNLDNFEKAKHYYEKHIQLNGEFEDKAREILDSQ